MDLHYEQIRYQGVIYTVYYRRPTGWMRWAPDWEIDEVWHDGADVTEEFVLSDLENMENILSEQIETRHMSREERAAQKDADIREMEEAERRHERKGVTQWQR